MTSRGVWEQEALKILHTRFERFPRTSELRRLYDDARHGSGVVSTGDDHAQQTAFAKWIASLIRRGYLMRLQRDLYANVSASIYPDSHEAAHLVRPTAVVSLQSVLGKTGTRNNPSAVVYAVVRSDSPDGTKPRDVRFDIQSKETGRPWEYRFVAMSPRLYFAGEEEDRLDASFGYPRATPERAFCDMVVANADPRMKIRSNWAFEADFSDLDMDRVRRLVEAMGIQVAYDAFMAQVPDDQHDGYSSRMGL